MLRYPTLMKRKLATREAMKRAGLTYEGFAEILGWKWWDVAGALGYPEDLVPWDGFDEDMFLVVGADGRSLYYSEDDMISYIYQNARALPHKIPKKYF